MARKEESCGPKEARPDLKGFSPETRDLNFASAVLARARARFASNLVCTLGGQFGRTGTRETQLPPFPWPTSLIHRDSYNPVSSFPGVGHRHGGS